MSKPPIIEPLAVAQKQGGGDQYHVFLAAVGFETRARFIAERHGVSALHRWAAAFDDRQVLAYKENLDWFTDAGFRVSEVSDTAYYEWLKERMSALTSERRGPLRVCLDVSSLSRRRIASAIKAAEAASEHGALHLDVLYAPASYSPPSDAIVPNVSIGPIRPDFAGWSSEPDKSPVLIMGVGYEHDKAIGAVEYIEPAAIWVFEPTGHDPKYTKAIHDSNESLWRVVSPRCRIRYSITDPYGCFVSLESLTYGLIHDMRPILLPFGPKVFTVCCLLVGMVHPQVSVWRVSSDNLEPAMDRVANGTIVGLRVVF